MVSELQWTGSEPVARSADRLEVWKAEIFGCYETMQAMIDMDPIEVFQQLSQFSARANEIRAMIGPMESKREVAFRIRIIDPFLEECDRQFKLYSRIQSVREMDAKLAGGRFA